VQLLSTETCIDQRVFSIWTCVNPERTDSLIHTIFPLSEKDEHKKETSKIKKVDLLELSSSKKARLLQKAKEKSAAETNGSKNLAVTSKNRKKGNKWAKIQF
jgi:hypothetical protein